MTEKEMKKFLEENKKQVEKAHSEFKKHSKAFDEKLFSLLSVL